MVNLFNLSGAFFTPLQHIFDLRFFIFPPLAPNFSVTVSRCRGIDSARVLCYSFYCQRLWRRHGALQEAQRGSHLVEGSCHTAKTHTTSEPTVGNGRPGAPVKASMSGNQLDCNQGGTVEYNILCIPPLIHVRGGTFFITAPQKTISRGGF